jgi:ubiquinone/menaquinone biosynthesis C-methylase UbiE
MTTEWMSRQQAGCTLSENSDAIPESESWRINSEVMKESAQDDSGLKRILTISHFYEFFQENILGGRNARKWLAKAFWKLKGGEAVVDLGCGPGTILKYLPPDVDYVGVDISENYIRAARKRFSAKGTFFLGTTIDFLNHNGTRLNSADLVLCNGLLHHLSDHEAIEVLELSKRIMKPDGRLVCLEATFLARQTRLSRWIVSSDRGGYVRSEQEWKNLIGQAFDSYSTSILTGLIRIPYTHIIIECVNERPFGGKGDLEISREGVFPE